MHVKGSNVNEGGIVTSPTISKGITRSKEFYTWSHPLIMLLGDSERVRGWVLGKRFAGLVSRVCPNGRSLCLQCR
jgi:hypothetical protein